MIKAKSEWKGDFKSLVDNGRGHEVLMDLPYLQNGTNEGITALEASIMGYAGCITTVYAMMADKLKFDLKSMVCNLKAEREESLVSKVTILLEVETTGEQSKLDRAFEMTHKYCPVGVIFREAGIEIESELIVK